MASRSGGMGRGAGRGRRVVEVSDGSELMVGWSQAVRPISGDELASVGIGGVVLAEVGSRLRARPRAGSRQFG
jgi:hypothetical protein